MTVRIFAAAGLTLAAAFAPSLASAQQQQRPAQPQQQQQQQPQAAPQQAAPVAPRPVTGSTQGWNKVCQKLENDREGCIISQEVRAENGAFLASLALQELQGENRRQLIVVVPLGMALQAGLLVRVDQERALPAKFGTCLPNGCFSGVDVGPDLLAQLRRGQNAFITVRNAQGVALDLTLPLATFARAYDGPATDARALQEQQRQLEDQLQRRADEARERLRQQQGGGAAPAPATPAPRQ